MTAEELPFGALGDLMESLVPIAAELVHASREDGPEVIRGVMLRLRSIEEDLPPEAAEQLRWFPHGVSSALNIVLAAMVSPHAGMRSLLGWTEQLVEPHQANRAASTRDGGWDPPAERERQRLVAAGVPADTAIVMASRAVIEQQETIRDRMLRVVARDGRRTA